MTDLRPDARWPETELEAADVCPICSSASRALLYEGLEDIVFRCAPGKWRSWRCLNCGSAYLSPRPSPASIHLAYATYYTHRARPAREAAPRQPYDSLGFAQRLRRRLANGYLNRRFFLRPDSPATSLGRYLVLAARPYKNAIDRFYRHLPPPTPQGRLLDVGCGDGSFLEIARLCGWSVEGVDPDPAAVANCRSRGLEVREGSIDLFDGQSALFDVITLAHVIEHAHDPIALARACRRLLKPDGRLWVETPNIDSLGHARYGRHWRGLEPPRHLVLFNAQSLDDALRAAGFARVETMPDMSPATLVMTSSEALTRGLPAEADIALSPRFRAMLLADRLRRLLSPSRREFLTVVARND